MPANLWLVNYQSYIVLRYLEGWHGEVWCIYL